MKALIGYQPWFEARAEKGYTFLMREALSDVGDVVRYDGIVATWRRHGRRLDALVLNWTDNDLLDRRTRRVAWRKAARLFARTIALRLAVRRLVFLRHNVYPHATAPGGEADATRWVDRYERLFDVVLTHSGDATQRSRRYCPHPLYPRVGPPIGSPARALPTDYVVAFGRIVRYKRLERLMTAFPDDRALVVVGAIGDRDYATELAAIARPNVVFAPGLIDEAEAQAIVAGSRALVIAHADPDVVVSSSFFFAMSLGVPVIAVATPFLRWVAPRLGDHVLRIADDVNGVCALVRQLPAASLSEQDCMAIDREFGADAVRVALRAIVPTVESVATRQDQ